VVDRIEDAARELYSVAPDDFMQRRGELADAARKKGDTASATAISKLRKPTVAAWVVNAYVLDNDAVIGKLTKLGDRLRAAQEKLDATKLRELTNERRDLIQQLTSEALRRAERTDPPAGLRDEVSGTFEAAVADEDVAARLGRLQRAEQWSGFGFLPSSSPELMLVRGGKQDAGKDAAKPAKKAAPKVSAAEKRKKERALAAAQKGFDEADAAFNEATAAERELGQQVKQLSRRLAKLQEQLDDAREQLEQARKEVTAARTTRREARSALDRAERDAAN
jgi:chromosome segregation ATPase